MTNEKENFLPADYKLPKSGSSYTKFEEGKTKLRILSTPLLGWIDWTEEEGKKKPLRFAYENKPEPLNPEKPIRHFWAFTVWNYKTKCVQIWEITQIGIQSKIKNYVESADWGIPTGYDLEIIREGMGFSDTNYEIQPVPPKPLTDEIKAIVEGVKVDLSKLLEGLDPFGSDSEKEAQTNEDFI